MNKDNLNGGVLVTNRHSHMVCISYNSCFYADAKRR
jgi:hypothetical protein